VAEQSPGQRDAAWRGQTAPGTIGTPDAQVDPEVARMTATIRPARPGDESDILRLIQALADYEREPDAVETTAEELRAHLFADVPRVFAHVAEQDGRVVGIAVWFLNFSTWTGRHGIYVEDLFVEPAVRGSGVALRLIRALATEAKAQGYARMEWAVLDWNEPAKAFYRRLGARHNQTWEPWRLDGEALAALQD
jgi:GNAT superfamily N-acetyltransferase